MDIPKYLTQTYILPQHIWSSIDDPANYTNEDAVGIGPLTTKGGTFTSMAWTLMWNPNYYNQPANHIDGARFVVYSSTTPEITDLNQGKIDWSALTLETGQKVDASVSQVNVPSSEVSGATDERFNGVYQVKQFDDGTAGGGSADHGKRESGDSRVQGAEGHNARECGMSTE